MTRSPREILLIKPGSLGDVVHAMPVAVAIKAADPSVRLTWVIDPRWAPLIHGWDCVDVVVEFPRTRFRGVGGWLRGLRWYWELRNLQPDLTIDLQGLLRSGLIARAARSRRVIGLSDAREGARYFCDAVADVSGVLHAVDRYLRVLPLCGVDVPRSPEFPIPALQFPPGLPQKFIALHPFARGAGKSLDNPAILDLCRELAPRSVVLFGMGSAPTNLPESVSDFTNSTTLSEMIGLLDRAACVISVDSGPMHVACALGKPLLAIHTWSDPRKVGPYSPDAWVVQGGEIRHQSIAPDAAVRPATEWTRDLVPRIARWAAVACDGDLSDGAF